MIRRLPTLWLLVTAIVCAVSIALAQADKGVQTAPSAAAAPARPAPTKVDVHDTTVAETPHGLAPLPGDQPVPGKLLPPGAFDPDQGPSDVIYPAQNMTLRFNHKFHVTDQKLQCKNCHAGALTSQSVQDRLIPPGTLCDSCHNSDHSNLAKVTAGDDDMGKCGFCHVGYKEGDGNKVAAFAIPRPNMVFTHKKHAERNIACQQCHGAVQELELATRDQLPRMRGCFGCHQMPDAAARGEAKAACETCHVRGNSGAQLGDGGRLQVMFSTGTLKPPRWLHNAAHTPDWIERHKMVAANDSQFCANCHKEDFCTACHAGRVRPRNIHPNDYISMHPIEARQATQKCTSCHREQSFCLGCHQRAGVTMSGPPGERMSGRFHPPKDVWSNAPRKPGHHAFEAERNLNACVSCHVERDCVVCHGGQGIGGGFNPHKSGFAGSCQSQLRRNPRPCFVCHQPGDGVLASCR